jgi:hypothetical protein
MSTFLDTKKFFQNEKKFKVGEFYETIMVKSPPYNSTVNIENCDEIGTIIPGIPLYLGKYVTSKYYGYGDNGTRCDYFINNKGEMISHYLCYEGTTRYRKISFIENRLPYLFLIEGLGDNVNQGGINEHINKFILNEVIIKEICSFMDPN